MTRQELDFQAMLRIRGGDATALEELYDRYTPIVYAVALRIVRMAADAEDVVQQTWIKAWKNAADYDSRRGTVAGWLLAIGRSRALDLVRSRAVRRRVEGGAAPADRGDASDPAASVAQVHAHRRVREAMASLDENQRRVLEIAYFEGLTQTEIAERLGAPLGTVKTWTRRALMRLRELLPQEEAR